MEVESLPYSTDRRIFRSVRAGIIYDQSVIDKNDLSSIEELYAPINVQVISADKLVTLLDVEFDIIGVLGQSTLDASKSFLPNFDCLKIGFYSMDTRSNVPRSSLSYLTAAITCIGTRSLGDSARKTVYHFYESLTLPSLLNIDLADVQSIARGIGISFNESGDSPAEIIRRLPSECYSAKSALLHFTCERNVTLEEVYKISQIISTRKSEEPFISESPGDQIKMYKRIRLKMGLRIVQNEPKVKTRPRISLTGILFGVKR